MYNIYIYMYVCIYIYVYTGIKGQCREYGKGKRRLLELAVFFLGGKWRPKWRRERKMQWKLRFKVQGVGNLKPQIARENPGFDFGFWDVGLGVSGFRPLGL